MEHLSIVGETITLRTITESDYYPLWECIYEEPNPEWKKWDEPYYPLIFQNFFTFYEQTSIRLDHEPLSRLIIEKENRMIGTVSFHWEQKSSQWLEVSVVIYDPNHWNGGYGTEALRLYMNHLFQAMPLVRVGLTTWSGNERMIKVAEKIGMRHEGRIRKCRYYKGEYYDSIYMGILREEWERNQTAAL